MNDMAKILPKPTRTISDLSDDERRVIRARHFGWESASPALLALVFSVPVQAINSVLKQPFAAPGEHGRADPLSSAPVTFDDRVSHDGGISK